MSLCLTAALGAEPVLWHFMLKAQVPSKSHNPSNCSFPKQGLDKNQGELWLLLKKPSWPSDQDMHEMASDLRIFEVYLSI